MKAKIFVIDFPMFDDVEEMMEKAFEDFFNKPCCEKKAPRWTPPTRPACGAPAPEWGIAGKPADENKRFGAGFEIDEPRCEDYDERWMFEDDHKAFDKFVDAGEDCIARGLGKKSDAPITKCQAVRQPVNCPPPMNKEFIGETHWWETTGW
jgi:hypothetical protein